MNLEKRPGESWDAYNTRAAEHRKTITAEFAQKIAAIVAASTWRHEDIAPDLERECVAQLTDEDGRAFTISLDKITHGRLAVAAAWPAWTDNTGRAHLLRPYDVGLTTTPHITLAFDREPATMESVIRTRFMPGFREAYDICLKNAQEREASARGAMEAAKRLQEATGGELRPNANGVTLYPLAGPRCDLANWHGRATVRMEAFSTDPDTAGEILGLLARAQADQEERDRAG